MALSDRAVRGIERAITDPPAADEIVDALNAGANPVATDVVALTDNSGGTSGGNTIAAIEDSVTSTAIVGLTDNTGVGATDDTIENLADGAVYANDHASIENNFADLAAKINELAGITVDLDDVKNSIATLAAKVNGIRTVLRTAGLMA